MEIGQGVVEYMALKYSRRQLERELIRAKEARARFRNDIRSAEWWRYYIELCEVTLSAGYAVTGKHSIVAAEVRSGVELAEYIGRYTELRVSGGDKLSGLCPLHGESHASLFVYTLRQDWFCYGCLKGGDIFNFVMALHEVSFYDALALLSTELSGGRVSEGAVTR